MSHLDTRNPLPVPGDEIEEPLCAVCGNDMEQFTPGIYECKNCDTHLPIDALEEDIYEQD